MFNNKNTLIYSVDNQVDFIEPTGKLYVPTSESLKPVFRKIKDFAKKMKIRVIHSQDWHGDFTEEISLTPDYVNTFPEHCVNNTYGAEIVNDCFSSFEDEVPYILDWDRKVEFTKNGIMNRNIIIRKDKFNVFEGNANAKGLLDTLIGNGINEIFVFGVVTEICVAALVSELLVKYPSVRVYLLEDAIMHLDKEKADKYIAEWSTNEKFSLVKSSVMFKCFEYSV